MTEPDPQTFRDLNKLPITIRLGNYTGEFLYWGFFPPIYWRNYLHIHTFFEICYAYQGHGLFRICDQEFAIGPGTMFIAKPDEPHEIIANTDDPLGIYFWSYTLIPTRWLPTQEEQSLSTTHSQQGLDSLLHLFGKTANWVSDKLGSIPDIMRLLTIEITTRQPGYAQKIHHLASMLLIDTARSLVTADVASPPLETSTNEAVEKIVHYLNDNYDRPIQVRDVAAQLHLSERHTSRIFQQAMGMSIQKYLVRLRITIAKQRLLDHSLPIAEVATSIGYRDARHFATLFRNHTGMTPTAFRNGKGTQFVV